MSPRWVTVARALASAQQFARPALDRPEAIKNVGSYQVPVKLVSDVAATLKVEVVAK